MSYGSRDEMLRYLRECHGAGATLARLQRLDVDGTSWLEDSAPPSQLARAMAVVDASVAWVEAELVASGGVHHSRLYEALVVQGFIDREGRRL